MAKTTDPALLAVKRLERRIETLEQDVQLFANGQIVLLDLLINTAISKGHAEDLEAALESLRGWYAHMTQLAFKENERGHLPGIHRAITSVDIFLERLRQTRGDLD
jgi:hypothetical protein